MKMLGVLMAMFIALVAVVVIFWMARNHEVGPDFLNEETPALIGAKSAESAEIARLTKQVSELKEELAEARAAAVVTADAPGQEKKKGKDGEGMMKTLAKMMGDPAMKDMMRQQQGIGIKGMYADFFRDLGLSEEDEAAVTELLIDKQMVNTELGVKMMGGELSDKEKKAIGKEIKENSDALDEEIKAVLGDDHFKSFELFGDSMQERQQLNTFKEGLKGKGLELSVEAEEQLMGAMYSTRKKFKFSTDFGSEVNPNPDALANFNQKNMEKLMGEMRQLNTQVAERASRILPPEQLEAFKASQESQLKMQEMGMKMGLQMQE